MKERAVYRIREFNQFYLPALDLLGNHYLGSEYSATETRILFEIYKTDGCKAVHIAKTLNIDKSYLSRIIKNQEKNGYLVRTVSNQDSRSFDIHLTDRGRQRTEDFIQKSNKQIGEIIEPLQAEECKKLIDALNIVTDILKDCKTAGS